MKNRKKILKLEASKIEYLIYIKNILENNLYKGSNYNIFLVLDPKIRVVMSESIIDKIINHYVARYILIPKLSKYLCPEITATRENMGLSYAIKLLIFSFTYFLFVLSIILDTKLYSSFVKSFIIKFFNIS